MSYREMVRKLRETLEDALDCTLYPGTKRHDAAIDLLAEADALLAQKEQEPVAWKCEWLGPKGEVLWEQIDETDPSTIVWDDEPPNRVTPLYTAPPDLQARVEELERGIDMLAMLFDKYENGPSCYEEPDERTGYLGNAVRLEDPDFHSIADFLNKHRPVGAAQESWK